MKPKTERLVQEMLTFAKVAVYTYGIVAGILMLIAIAALVVAP